MPKKNLVLLLLLIFSRGAYCQNPTAHRSGGKVNGFEANKGQWPGVVSFKTDAGNERRLFIEKDRFTWVFSSQEDLARQHDEEHEYFKTPEKINDVIRGHAFRMIFMNASPSVQLSGNNKLSYYHNYFIGNDPSKWAGEVPVYSELLYKEIYPGINIDVRYQNRQLKYDFIVTAGADPSLIRLKIEGANGVYLKNNRLHVQTSVGELIESAPYSYQIIDGMKKEVPCRFVLNKESGEVSFLLPDGYDKRHELIIDPVVVASTHSGATSTVYGHTATHDINGNIYTGGRCFGQGYPVTMGAFQTTFGGSVDASISKLNPNGSTLIWATFLGGSAGDYAHSMFANDEMELYVYGTTSSADYPVSQGCFDNSYNGGTDIVVTKLNASGTALIGSTYVGGTAQDGNSVLTHNFGDNFRGEIVVNLNDEPYVISNSMSGNFPVTAGAYDQTANGGQDAVLFKMNSNLSSMIFSTFLGGSGNDAGFGIRLNTCGEIYVVGATVGQGFPTTAGALNTGYLGGTSDAYIARFNANGSTLMSSSFYGTPLADLAYFIDIDVSNDVYIFGNTTGSLAISPGAYGNPGSKNFIAKFQPGLNTLLVSTLFGNGQVNTVFAPSAFMVDIFKNIYACGWGNTSNYPVTPNALYPTPSGQDFYLLQLTPNASTISYGTHYGSPAGEHVDGGTSRYNQQGVVYQAVCECGASLPSTPWAYAPNNIALLCDIAVFKIDFQNGLIPPFVGTVICAGNTTSISANIPTGVANPSFSYQPGGIVSNSPVFTVSPNSNTTYTLYGYGLNCNNAQVTLTNVITVSVNPNPVISPSVSNMSCSNNTNSVNLNVSFIPGGAPNYTVTWSPNPSTFVAVNSGTAAGLTPGVQNVTVTTGNGCQTTASMNITDMPPPVSYTVSGPMVIDCYSPVITLSATTNYTYGTLSYTWSSLSFTSGSSTVSISQGGTVNVYGVDPATGCGMSQSVAITANTVSPTNSVNPITQMVNCNTISAVTFSGSIISPTINFLHSWYGPINPPPGGPAMSSCGTSVCPLTINTPGTYTFISCNTVNGCCTSKTVEILSSASFPVFTMASSTNYSLGCDPLHQSTLSIVNPSATGSPPGTTTYAFLAPSYTGAPVFSTSPTSTVLTTPGTWTVVVMDQSNGCRTTVYVPITQNTIAPQVSAALFTQTLTCKHPTILATGTSSTPNTIIEWNVPLPPPNNLPSNTLVIGTSSVGPPTSSTSLSYANYTVTATNTVNACRSLSVISIAQNFKPPVADPKLSANTPTAIYCNANVKPAMLTTGNSTVTSGIPNAFASNPCWQGPLPQYTICGASTYSCFVPGIYTLTITDSENGCSTSNTIEVIDRTQPPVLTNPIDSAVMDCASNSATLLTAITGPSTGLKYYFYHYPFNTLFAPNDANAPLEGTSSPTISVSQTGEYEYIVTNTLTGCKAYGSFIVYNGSLRANFSAEPELGYAPLNVSFTNLSASNNGSANINSIWSFGNGSSHTGTGTAVQSMFSAPGTYTVMLLVNKGQCLDTAYKVIRVEMPSKLEIPNIFTPNGDGSNDVFFVRSAGLAKIEAIIFDRWGNKVYETSSTTGNIAWDGLNLKGDRCAEGVYFYLINATGNDDKMFEHKGNVTLIR